MTQIKLRRDTSANFTSKNPILGAGEPAYETDTKKLKIGDGATAYTQLEYFSSGGGGSADIGAALPLKIVNGVISLEVDGQTIQVVDGKLAASANMVTTDTAQTITGTKTFKGPIKVMNSGYTRTLADVNTNGGIPYLYLGESTSRMYLQASTPINRMSGGGIEYPIIDTGNLGSYVDGTTITYANNKLSTTVSGLEICDIGMALYVDESKGLRRYLNGQIVDINTNTQAFLNRLKQITTLHPSLLCTEDEWQTAKTMSAFGQVGKFVFNYSGDEIVSVRLPRVVNVQGLFDLQKLGMMVKESLPNFEIVSKTSSAVQNGTAPAKTKLTTVSQAYGISANATSYRGTSPAGMITNDSDLKQGTSFIPDSSTYQDNAPVQQEAIQYPYFIQIATGSETENNIINEIELNNPYSLFDSKYSDHELNNLSWLKSEGQWNSKAVYTDAYDELLTEYNNSTSVNKTEGSITFKCTPKGYKIALADQETAIDTKYTTDGIAWYYILDTTNEKFKLPRTKFGFEGLRTSVGDDVKAGLPNITGTAQTAPGCSNYIVNGALDAYITQNATGVYSLGSQTTSAQYGISFNASRSNPIYGNSDTVQSPATQMYLYFYVGETVQNANLIDAGRIGEQLATKTDMLQASGAGMPSNRYIDLTLGANGSTYTAPANGYFQLAVLSGTSIQFYNQTKASFWKASSSTGDAFAENIECQAGDIIKCYYTYDTFRWFRFYYAEGSK